VPEGIIKPLELETEVPVYATFDLKPGERFALTFKESATRADPKTQTFEVRYTMPAPKDFTLLPGMTATVTADLREVFGEEQVFFLPVTAIAGDTELASFVWVVDEQAGTVKKQPVELGRMVGNDIAVTGEIEPGRHVVTAGTGYLAEGMKVRTVAQPEQAKPRPDDVPLMLEPSSPAAAPEGSGESASQAEQGATE
jgi:RND family efflux transporter MFP subunit